MNVGPDPEDLYRNVTTYAADFGAQFHQDASSRNQVTLPPGRRPCYRQSYAAVAGAAPSNGNIYDYEYSPPPPAHSSNFGHPFPEAPRTRGPRNHREPPPTPKMIPKEFVIITTELHKKLRNASPFSVPFFYKFVEVPQSSDHQHLTHSQLTEAVPVRSWKWHDRSYVRIPLSRDYTQGNTPKWVVIDDSLFKLKETCLLGFGPDSNDNIHHFRKTIAKYNDKAKNSSNFGVIQNDLRVSLELMRQLPGIINHALKLPCRLQTPIPILKRGEPRTIYLSRNLACSLLANAFLCTFPEQDGRTVPYFHFYSLFDEVDNPTKTKVKREKVKCLLNYFAALAQPNPKYPNTIISYERRCIPTKFNWALSTDLLSNIEITSQQRLENNVGMLQVDFANKWVGGGVLNEGAVQEEIRFVISPELIIARLFTEPLDDDEVLVVTGTAQYSSYTGYCNTFQWAELPNYRPPAELDNLGREHTQVVAMDALFFKPYEVDKQYREDKLKRELHKCYVAFTPGRHPTPVATGLWGCGCFNGDPQLKFLIQWMAASVRGRPMMFHCDENMLGEFSEMAKFLQERKVNVGKLYNILCRYYSSCVEYKSRSDRKSVFFFVRQEIIGRFWGGGIPLGRGR